MCNFRSTWEVISNSEDFKDTVPMVAPPPPPVFSLLRIRERTVCLVLDKSENMKVSFMGKFGQVLGGDTTDQSGDEARRKVCKGDWLQWPRKRDESPDGLPKSQFQPIHWWKSGGER